MRSVVALFAAVGFGCASSGGTAGTGGSTGVGGIATSLGMGGLASMGGRTPAGGAGTGGIGGTGATLGGGAGQSASGGRSGAESSAGSGSGSGGNNGHGGLEGGFSGAGAGGSGAQAGNAGGGGKAGRGGSMGAGGAAGAAGAGGIAGMAGAGATSSGPPMGWASWNSFAAKINDMVIKGQADAMVSSGLQAAGYRYVNIDEGWWQGTRDAAGNITVDTSEWPGGMQAIADYIHGLGLKAGIYTDAGKDGCGYYYPTGRPAAPGSGSEGHYDQDFLAFSKWGFDFVKVDWCGGDKEGLDAATAYKAIASSIAKATAQTGRPMVFSVCNWGNQSPWNWASSIATMWRTSQDIIYYGNAPDISKVFGNYDSAQHAASQTPGHYNDPDMLIVGMSGFSAAQNRTHLALWAISSAPLLAGNQLDTMNSDTKSVLTNAEVIAIDQDPLAHQGVKVSDDGGRQVYNKVLSGTGRRAVLLLNRTTAAAMITVRFADIGLGATASVRNVWTAMDLGSQTTSYATSVPAQDSVLLVVTDGA